MMIPISIQDAKRDEQILWEGLFEELSKRQYFAERDGYPTNFSINDIWSARLGGFSNSYFRAFLSKIERETHLIEIISDDEIRFTRKGREIFLK